MAHNHANFPVGSACFPSVRFRDLIFQKSVCTLVFLVWCSTNTNHDWQRVRASSNAQSTTKLLPGPLLETNCKKSSCLSCEKNISRTDKCMFVDEQSQVGFPSPLRSSALFDPQPGQAGRSDTLIAHDAYFSCLFMFGPFRFSSRCA